MADDQPKKTLTEAQRLAFLKGREKRMANIEKKRLEDEEKKAIETQTFSPPPKPKMKRQPKVKPEPIQIPATPDETKSDPTPEHILTPIPSTRTKALSDGDIDVMVSKIMSKIDTQIGDTILDKLMNSLPKAAPQEPPPKKPRKPRAKKEPGKNDDTKPAVVPTNNFTWM